MQSDTPEASLPVQTQAVAEATVVALLSDDELRQVGGCTSPNGSWLAAISPNGHW